MHPLVTRAERYKIPRGVSVFAIYVLFTSLFVAVGWLLAPLLVQEVTQISQNFGTYWDKVVAILPDTIGANIKTAAENNINSIADAARSGISVTISSLLSTVQGFVDLVGSIIIVLFLAFYFIVEERAIRRALLRVLPIKFVPFADRLLTNSQFWLGGWARGQIVLSLSVGICVYIALVAIGVPYAFALAALAALVEFIPYIGPIFSGVFGVFFALTISPSVALITAIAYYVIQLLENNILIPKIMQKTAGVNPVLSFLMIMIAFEALGFIGVFLGVPIASLVMAWVESMEPKSESVI